MRTQFRAVGDVRVAIGIALVVWAVSEPLVLDVPAPVTRLECLGLALALTLPLIAIGRWPIGAAGLLAGWALHEQAATCTGARTASGTCESARPRG